MRRCWPETITLKPEAKLTLLDGDKNKHGTRYLKFNVCLCNAVNDRKCILSCLQGWTPLQTKQKQKLYPAIWKYFSVIQKLEWSKEFLLVVHPAGLRHSCTKTSQTSAEIYAVRFTEQNKQKKKKKEKSPEFGWDLGRRRVQGCKHPKPTDANIFLYVCVDYLKCWRPRLNKRFPQTFVISASQAMMHRHKNVLLAYFLRADDSVTLKREVNHTLPRPRLKNQDTKAEATVRAAGELITCQKAVKLTCSLPLISSESRHCCWRNGWECNRAEVCSAC